MRWKWERSAITGKRYWRDIPLPGWCKVCKRPAWVTHMTKHTRQHNRCGSEWWTYKLAAKFGEGWSRREYRHMNMHDRMECGARYVTDADLARSVRDELVKLQREGRGDE
jgi:hypothetical protein